MAFLDSNRRVHHAKWLLSFIGDDLRRISFDIFPRRDVLTDDDVLAIRNRIASVKTNLQRLDDELADPASGFRKPDGGVGA